MTRLMKTPFFWLRRMTRLMKMPFFWLRCSVLDDPPDENAVLQAPPFRSGPA